MGILKALGKAGINIKQPGPRPTPPLRSGDQYQPPAPRLTEQYLEDTFSAAEAERELLRGETMRRQDFNVDARASAGNQLRQLDPRFIDPGFPRSPNLEMEEIAKQQHAAFDRISKRDPVLFDVIASPENKYYVDIILGGGQSDGPHNVGEAMTALFMKYNRSLEAQGLPPVPKKTFGDIVKSLKPAALDAAAIGTGAAAAAAANSILGRVMNPDEESDR